MKKYLIILMLVFASAGYSQSFDTQYREGGINFGIYFPDVDSTGTLTSNWLTQGWDLIDNQTISLTHLFGAGTGGGTITNDSVRIIIEGRTPYKTSGGFLYLTTQMDTIIVAGGTSAGQIALTLSSYHPEVRLIVSAFGHSSTANQNNRTLALAFYARVNDVVNPRNQFYW